VFAVADTVKPTSSEAIKALRRPGLHPVLLTGDNAVTARAVAAQVGIDDVVADVGEKGREAMRGAREVRDTVSDMILDSIKTRPYTTLAIAGFIGFLYGAMRRR
jgi:Cu+-exporting ATPase